MTGLLLSSLCVLMCAVSARDIVPPIPVVVEPHGLRYQPVEPRPQLQLEIFISLHCSDSYLEWGILKQVQSYYGASKLDLVVQQMALPYQRNTFLATKALYAILNSTAASQVFNYIEESMFMSSNFSTANTVDLSELQVQDMIADVAVRTTGIDRAYLIANIPAHSLDARYAWKYAAKRQASSTPTFFLNNVDLGTGPDLPTYEEWLTFLNPLVK